MVTKIRQKDSPQKFITKIHHKIRQKNLAKKFVSKVRQKHLSQIKRKCHQSRFLEAPLVRQADGELKNGWSWVEKVYQFFNFTKRSQNSHFDQLGSIWYHSEPSKVF